MLCSFPILTASDECDGDENYAQVTPTQVRIIVYLRTGGTPFIPIE